MLFTMVDVISCENPECREFARIMPTAREVRFHYCPVCCTVSRSRPVDSKLAESESDYKAYLLRAISQEKDASPM